MKIYPASVSLSIKGQSTFTSGIMFNDIIITHASLMAKILIDKKFDDKNNVLHIESDKLKLIGDSDFKGLNLKFIICYNDSQSLNLNIDSITSEKVNLIENNITRNNERFERVKLCAFWQSSSLAKQVHHMLSNWTIGQTLADKNNQHMIAKHLLSTFVILEKNNIETSDEFKIHKITSHLKEILSFAANPIRGQHIYVISTPFGNNVFLNSISKGIISKTLGKNAGIFLTDASSALCSEGGIVLDKQLSKLLGVVISSVSWWCGEWVGLTINTSWSAILSELNFTTIYPSIHTTNINLLNYIDNSVVIVRCGDVWGSGVLVNKKAGIFLTCSHVIENYKIYGAKIFWKDQRIPANLVFKTEPGRAADIAVLKANSNLLCDMIPAVESSMIKNGDIVYAAGFPFYNNTDISKITPFVTQGIVSKLHLPIMIQTTCCIQSGFSGGGMFSSDGKLIAITVSNTHSDKMGALYPNLNFGVPATFIMKIINKYIKTKDLKLLQELNLDESSQKLWKLDPVISKL